MSDDLLDEYQEVLQRAPFGVSPRTATRLVGHLAALAIKVSPKATKAILTRDPDDDMVLKAAIAGKADYLVTDNRRDFEELAPAQGRLASRGSLTHRGVHIVGLSECLNAIRAAHPGALQVMQKRSRWP